MPDKFAAANRLPVVYPPPIALYYLVMAAVAGLLVSEPWLVTPDDLDHGKPVDPRGLFDFVAIFSLHSPR